MGSTADVALEALAELRVDAVEYNTAPALRPWPIGVILVARKIVAQHAAADGGAFQALLLDRGFQHGHREIGRLHRQRRKGAETVRLLRAQLGELLVVDLADLLRGLAVLAVPEWIDRQYLHVDSHRVHLLETLLDHDEVLLHALHRRRNARGVLAHQVDRFLEEAMRVAVDGLDALALHHHGQPRSRLLRMRLERQPAAAEHKPGERTGRFQEIPARGHEPLPAF